MCVVDEFEDVHLERMSTEETCRRYLVPGNDCNMQCWHVNPR
jgi:hypothetical protein